MNENILAIRRGFSNQVENLSDMFLLSASDAISYVLKGYRLGLHLAGVESFTKLTSGAIQPVQDFSNDIADTTLGEEEFLFSTLKLIEKGARENMLFEVVFET